MHSELTQTVIQNVNILNTFLLLTAIMAVVFRRIRSQITAYFFQSVALALICVEMGRGLGNGHLYVAAALTFAAKCVLIPLFLFYISRKTMVVKDGEKFFKIPTALLISGILIIFSFYILQPVSVKAGLLTKASLNTSLSLILIGLFLMINRTFALTQIMGILIIENGLFLAGIATTCGMPLIVELGAFFDVIVGVVLMGVMTNKISRSFESLDTEKLNLLKY
jgi:hydrogenase-4 component E